MVRRWSIACLFAALLQFASTAVPASDLVICVSADGRAALERAVPGTARCGDTTCEDVLADSTDHSCRDIPLLSAGDDLATGTAASIEPSVVVATVRRLRPAPAGQASLTSWATPLPAAWRRRSVVLIL